LAIAEALLPKTKCMQTIKAAFEPLVFHSTPSQHQTELSMGASAI
jgi:hypothetical protein